jgi:hypothetical protein
VQHEKTEKKRYCKFTLAKFLAPGPSKGMKSEKKTKRNLA